MGPSDKAKEVGQAKKEIAERYIIRRHWWTLLISRSAAINKLHAHITPSEYSWIGTSSGIRGLNLNYVVTQDKCGAELYIDRGKNSDDENKAIFDLLHKYCSEINAAFGEPLSWERLEGKRACRVRYFSQDGGYRTEEGDWPEIQDKVIHAMDTLEKAVRPYLKQLKLAGEIRVFAA